MNFSLSLLSLKSSKCFSQFLVWEENLFFSLSCFIYFLLENGIVMFRECKKAEKEEEESSSVIFCMLQLF